MARPKHPRASPRMGRPTKGASATVAQVSVRLTEADLQFLEAIQATEQARVEEEGLYLKISPADAFRLLLRREAERRGLNASMAQAS